MINPMLTQTLTERNSDRRHAMRYEVSERAQARFLAALKVDPSLIVREGKKRMLGSAANVFVDFVSDTEERTHQLAQLIVAAANGEDVQLQAQLMLSVAVRRFGDDAADFAEDEQ